MNPPVLINVTLLSDAGVVVQIYSTNLSKQKSRIRPNKKEDP